MTAALRALEEGASLTRASRDFGVPRSTLHDRVSGRVVHGVKPGPKPYLDEPEEKELSSYLKHCANVSYGKMRKDVLCIVETATSECGRLCTSHVSDGWWRWFKERQGDLSVRQGDSTGHVRMDAMNRETIDHYFALLHNTLTTHNLLSQIYNVDESGVPLNPRPPKVVTSKGRVTKKVRYRTSGRKGQIIVVGCANASGQFIPPMIIYDATRLNPAWTKDEVAGTKYGLSSNGWINTDLFEAWFVEHFLENAVSARPLFLLLDGHSTHYQPQVIRVAREHQCIILCLPPHITHETQPLDVGVFAPLKVQWTKTCHEFYQKNPGSIVTKFNFSRLFSQAWCRAVTPANVIAGFRRAGLYPFNPNAISLTEDTSSDMCCTPSRYEANSSDQDASHQTSPSSAVTGDSTPSCTATECLPNVAAPSHSSTAGDISDRTSNTVFSAEQEEHFERRYEGGYDLPDPVYEEWLKLRHPPSFRATSPPGTSSGQELSLSDQFTAVSPLTPVALNVTIVSGASTSSGATSSKPTEHTPTLLSSGSSGSSGRKKDDSLSKQLVVPSAATPAGPKKAEEIDESKCCVCFTMYEEDIQKKSGKDWVMCACSRWLHEECAEDCTLDNTGKERLCQLCLDLYVT